MVDRSGRVIRLDEPLCGCDHGLIMDSIQDQWGRLRVLPLSRRQTEHSVRLPDGTILYAMVNAITPVQNEYLKDECGMVDKVAMERLARALVLHTTDDYFRFGHPATTFDPEHSSVPVSGRTYGAVDIRTLVDSALDFWLTAGRYNTNFERRFAEVLGVKHVLTVNSGSSANLLALASLTSQQLGNRRVSAGDEMITVAAGFPTTVNPALLYGLIPVFVDVDARTYNAIPDQVADAVNEKTRIIMLAHTLGNPFDLEQIREIADRHNLWLIEDCCDALGTRYSGQLVGTFGHLATFSFYPAHHITMGEGGAVVTNDPHLKKIVESLRDWGRDCWCEPGRDNTCRKRFAWQHGKLPPSYDHKYVYSHAGYNLKITDMQAAVGYAQLEHLQEFIEQRRNNYKHLRDGLVSLQEFMELPEKTPGSEPAWFGFPITLLKGKRSDLQAYLGKRRIGTRLIFGGNLTRQPYFEGQKYRLHGSLQNTDRIMHNALWLGVYPGLGDAQIDYMIDTIRDYFTGGQK